MKTRAGLLDAAQVHDRKQYENPETQGHRVRQ